MRVLAVLAVLTLLPLAAADHGFGIRADNLAAPTPEDVQAAIAGLEGTDGLTIIQMGTSSQGRPIFVVEAVDPTSTVPMEERVTVFIMTQQHGNEPAGTPAALDLLADLQAGTVTVPEDMVLLVMPQSNPDGALANQRAGAHGEDINRDHVDVGTPESLAIHAVLKQWDVHMAFDHHEYGGSPTGGVGHPSPVGSYDFDITTMHPNHGNVREPTRAMALEVNEAIKAELAAHGFTHGDYGMTTVRAGPLTQDVQQVAGGPDPGILRNSFGLNNVAGLLIESFVPPASEQNPLQSFDRRVESQRVVMDAVLDFAAANVADIIEAKRESERLNLEDPMTHYLEGDATGAIPDAYAMAEGHLASFEAHGLPVPAQGDGGWFTHAVMKRGGLVAAMLHDDSSRQIGASITARAQFPAEYLAHDEFHLVTQAPLATEEATQDAAAPGLAPLAAISALAALVMLQRRR